MLGELDLTMPGPVDELFELALLGLVLVSVVVILRKAGYSGWWALVTVVPILNVVMLAVFAFRTWPVTRRSEAADREAHPFPPKGSIAYGLD
jgi:hypothetical protein